MSADELASKKSGLQEISQSQKGRRRANRRQKMLAPRLGSGHHWPTVRYKTYSIRFSASPALPSCALCLLPVDQHLPPAILLWLLASQKFEQGTHLSTLTMTCSWLLFGLGNCLALTAQRIGLPEPMRDCNWKSDFHGLTCTEVRTKTPAQCQDPPDNGLHPKLECRAHLVSFLTAAWYRLGLFRRRLYSFYLSGNELV